MKRRAGMVWSILVAALVVFVTPSFAGGWATVTLDSIPGDVQSGALINLGFMVRQHGKTPIDNNPFEGVPLQPYLVATNMETGDTLRVDARKEGELGHFVVDVSFPSAGEWQLEIVPPPFAGTKFKPLTVSAAAPQPHNGIDTKGNGVTTPITATSDSTIPITTRWTMGVVAVLVVLMLVVLSRRLSWRQAVKGSST